VRGLSDLHLLETPEPDLLHEVTGLELERSGHVLLDERTGIRSTQRLALGDVGGGIVVFTWPAELRPQARYLYRSGRAQRLLVAADEGHWKVDTRPHLAFWLSSPEERLYMNPTIGPEDYVSRWSGSDFARIGQHDSETIRGGLWPWLLERGYASPDDEGEVDRFLARLAVKKRRAAHLRPGLRLLRCWGRDEVAELRRRCELAREIRAAVDQLLLAVDDPPLPARS
jgi:O-acetyl-ADP-ribose deacetylase